MKNNTILLVLLCAVTPFCIPDTTMGQQVVTRDLFTEYERVLQLQGIVPLHSVMNQPYSNDLVALPDTLGPHPWKGMAPPLFTPDRSRDFYLSAHDPELKSYWRSARPGGSNDGAVWQGRGLTTAFTGGVFLKFRNFSASIRPVVIYNQNSDFGLSPYPTPSGRSEYAWPFGNLDQPQRSGDAPFWTFDPGPSFIRADAWGWAAGISNQNLWWGPARQNAILMSNNAPGFPHLFLGTGRPKDIGIGKLETKLFWGKLLESDYFDRVDYNNERYITGLILAYSPEFVPGLTVGGGRIFYETIPPEGIPPADLLKVFEGFLKKRFRSAGNEGGNDLSDQILSFYGRWAFPESGFEVYGEWSRTDHSWDLRDFLSEPEHTRAYTVGLQKTFGLSHGRILALNAELTQLEAGKTSLFRAAGSYYLHHRSIQGYTHRGQLLGAGIGPGSNSQHLSGEYYFEKGRLSLWVRRVVYNNDFLYRSNAMMQDGLNSPNVRKYWLHNVELFLGSSLTWFHKRTETSLDLALSRMLNEHYIYRNDLTQLSIGLSFRYHLSPLR